MFSDGEEEKGSTGKYGGWWLSCVQATLRGITSSRGMSLTQYFSLTNSGVCNTFSGCSALPAFVVYRNVVDYRMELELLGHIHDSRIRWKARDGQQGNSAPVEGQGQANTAQGICLMVFFTSSHTFPDKI